jgi:hypothetical protein
LNGSTILTHAIQGYRKVTKPPLYAWILLAICLAGILLLSSISNPPSVYSPSLSKPAPASTNKNIYFFYMVTAVGFIRSFLDKRTFVIINTSNQVFQTPDLENADTVDRILQALNQVTRRA